MPSASEAAKKRSKSGPPTLTGSDVRGTMLNLSIVSVEEAPEGWESPLVLTFKPPVKSLQSERGTIEKMGLNQTNTKTLVRLFGDDFTKWARKKITLGKVSANNPKTGKATSGLRVMG